MCGGTPARGLGRTWTGRFAARWLEDDLVLLRPDSTSWPSPGNVLVVLDGDGAALIDCGFGTPDSVDALAAGLRVIGRTLESVHTVVCTHPHADHAGAASVLVPGRRVIVPHGAREVLDDPVLVAEAVLPPVVCQWAPWLADLDVEGHFRSECGAAPIGPRFEVEEIAPGEVIELGRYSWTAVPTPGHDAHLMCYWERRSGMFIYSDLLSTRGTAIPWYAPGGGGTGAYLESLRRVVGLRPALGISGHGGLLEGADAVEAAADATAGQILTRKQRISDALARGPVSFAELERCVYPPVVHEVIPWASSVAAVHLAEALESGEARVTEQGFGGAGGAR